MRRWESVLVAKVSNFSGWFSAVVWSLPEGRGCRLSVHRPERASRASDLQEGTWPLWRACHTPPVPGRRGPGGVPEERVGRAVVRSEGWGALPCWLGACSTSVWLLLPRVGPQCGEIARSLPASSSGEAEGVGGYFIGAQSRSPAFPDSWHPLLQLTR